MRKTNSKNWVRVRVKKPNPYVKSFTGRLVLLPEAKPKPDTEYPTLPFLREYDLEEQVITLLTTVPDYYTFAAFSPIPAIKHAKETMGWGLIESKDYVDKVYKNNLDKIEAARVVSLKKWKEEHDA